MKGEPPQQAQHSICHLYPMEISMTHSHTAYNPNNHISEGGIIVDVELVKLEVSDTDVDNDPVSDQINIFDKPDEVSEIDEPSIVNTHPNNGVVDVSEVANSSNLESQPHDIMSEVVDPSNLVVHVMVRDEHIDRLMREVV